MIEPIRVLFIDCDPVYCESIRDSLGSQDIEVLTATNEQEALARAKECPNFDVAVVGHVDEPQNALHTVQSLGSEFSNSKIILLATNRVGQNIESFAGWADRYLPKTSNVSALALSILTAARYDRERHHQRVLDAIHDVGTAMQSAAEPPGLFKEILQGIKALGYDRARVFLLDNNDNCLRGMAETGGTRDPINHVVLPVDKDEYHADLIKRGKPVIFRAGDHIDLNTEVLQKEGLEEWAEVPLRAEDRIIGKISVDNKSSRRQLTQEDLDDLEFFAVPCAAAIVRVLRNLEFQKSQATLVEAGRKISAAKTKRALYDQIWQQAQGLLPRLDSLLITEYDAITDVVSFLLYNNQGHDETIPPRQHGNGITEYVIRTKRPYLLPKGDMAFRVQNSLEQAEYPGPPSYSALIVPMFIEDEVVGTINAMCNVRDIQYTNHHLEVLQAFANQAAISIENIRQIEEAVQLHEATKTLASRRGYISVVKAIVTNAHQLINPDLTGLVIQDRSGILHKAELVEPPDQLDHFENPRQQGGISRWVVNERIPRFIFDTADDDLVKESIRAAGIKSMLAMPMIFENRVVAVLYAHFRRFRYFNTRDINLWSAFAAQAAGALNSALEEQQNNVWQDLEKELATLDDPKQLDLLLTRHVRRAMRADLVVFYHSDPMSPHQTLPDRCAFDGTLQAAWKNPEGGKTAGVIQKLCNNANKQLVIDDTNDPKDRAVSNFSLREGIQSFVGMRLDVIPEEQTQPRMAGLLFVNYREKTHFDPADLAGLRAACDHAASAILRLRLKSALQDQATLRNKQLRAVVDVFKAFRNQRDSQHLIYRIAKAVEETTDADVLSVLALDSKTNQLVKRAEAGAIVQGRELTIPRETMDSLLNQEGPTVMPVSEQPKLKIGDLEREQIISAVVYPLRAEGETEGLLIAGYRTPREFTRDETEVIGIFADLGATVMHEGQMRAELQKKQRQLEISTVLTWVSLIEDLWRHTTIQNASSIRNYVEALNIRLKRMKYASSPAIEGTIKRIDRLAEAIAKAPARVPEATEMQREIFALAPVLKEVARRERSALSLVRRAPVQIKFHPGSLGNHEVRGFRRWVVYALEALVQNACKAMPPRGGMITIRGDLRGEWAEIRIQDDGTGVPHEIRNKLFLELPPKRNDSTGMGIGGLLVAAIAELHGGTVELEKPGPGDTTVLIRLPVAKGTKI